MRYQRDMVEAQISTFHKIKIKPKLKLKIYRI